MNSSMKKFAAYGLFIGAAMALLLFVSATPPKPQPKKPALVEISTKFGKIKIRLYDETPLHRDNFLKLVKQGFYDSLLFHRVVPELTIQGGDPNSKYATHDSVLGMGGLGYTIPAEIRPNLYHKRGVIAAARDNNPEKASNACQFYIVQGKKFTPQDLINIENNLNLELKRNLVMTMMYSDSSKKKFEDFTLRGDTEGRNAYVKSIQPIADKMFEKQGRVTFSDQAIKDYMTIGGAPFLDQSYTVFGEVIEGMNIVDSIAATKTLTNDRPVQEVRMKIRIVQK